MRTIIVHKTNSFRLGTTKKYAVLAFKEDGLKILCTNENPENFDTLVLALASRVGIIYLPTIVMQAYGLEREDYEVEIINENKFFIRRKRLFDISFEKPLAMEEDQAYFLAERAANKNVRGYKMSLGKEENITSTKLRVDMYFGEKNYAKIICVDDIPKDANTLSDIREIYGRNLLMYPYNSVRYYIDGSTNKTFATKGYATAILFPVPFLRHWGISNGSGEVEVRITKDGPIVSPVARTCEIAGKRIEPINEPIKKIRVCGEHTSEKDQIKEMVQLIRGISEMCQNIKNNNEQLRSRVEKLEAALF